MKDLLEYPYTKEELEVSQSHFISNLMKVLTTFRIKEALETLNLPTDSTIPEIITYLETER